MSGFDDFLGNEKLKRRMVRDVRARTLSHAYILEGAPGTGKRTFARLICAALSCDSADPPCMKCRNCDHIMRMQSPDVMEVTAERDRVQLGVDVVRRLRADTAFAANDLQNKFYLFPDADSMNIQAQNALLKVLEEPPAGVMFLLLCNDADNLLSTIRSRAPVLRLEPLEDELIERGLLARSDEAKRLYETDAASFHVAVRLSGGSLGRALELCTKDAAAESMRLWNTADGFIKLLAKRYCASGQLSTVELEFYDYALKLAQPKQRAELRRIYLLLAAAARDLLAAKLAGEFTPLFYPSPEMAREMASHYPLAKLFTLSDLFAEMLAKLDANVNLSLAQCRAALVACGAKTDGYR